MACQLICPNLRCRKILSVPEEVRGKLVKCQHCQTMFRVPEPKRSPWAYRCCGPQRPAKEKRSSLPHTSAGHYFIAAAHTLQ